MLPRDATVVALASRSVQRIARYWPVLPLWWIRPVTSWRARCRAHSPCGGIERQISVQRRGHLPADDHPAEDIQHERHGGPARVRASAGQVGDHELVRGCGDGLPFDLVRRPLGLSAVADSGLAGLLPRDPTQALGAHQPLDGAGATVTPSQLSSARIFRAPRQPCCAVCAHSVVAGDSCRAAAPPLLRCRNQCRKNTATNINSTTMHTACAYQGRMRKAADQRLYWSAACSVELRGIEPLTFSLRTRRSTN